MIYILVNNDHVINGPRAWNYRSFESTLVEDLEIEFKLPMTYTSTEPIVIDENTKIVSCRLEYAAHNPKIEYLHGPFWNFDEEVAIGTFQVMPTPVDVIKGALKQQVAGNRWIKEVSGTTAEIQGKTVTIDTSRDGRNIFVQKYLLMSDSDTVEWKFPEGWLVLSRAELGSVVNAGVAHVQNQFSWEAAKITEIDSCTTSTELDLVDLGDPAQQNTGA
jgi:hypothetical protein